MPEKGLSHVKLIKCVEIAHFFFLCYVRTVYLEDLKLALVVLHLIFKKFFKPLGKRSKMVIVCSQNGFS